MTLRSDIITDAQAAWFDTDGLAQPATYKAAGSSAGIATAVVVQYSDNLGGQGRYLMEEMVALVPAADVARPRSGDTITLESGESWTVRKIKSGDALGIGWMVGCTREERPAQRG